MLTPEMQAGIVAHMNDDHADAVLLYAQVLAGKADATSAVMIGIDAQEIILDVIDHDEQSIRVTVPLPETVTTPGGARNALIDMVKQARAAR